MADLCRHCGKVEGEHHAFEAAKQWKLPPGCACDPLVYYAEPLPICDAYRPFGTDDVCLNCEHDHACHKGKG